MRWLMIVFTANIAVNVMADSLVFNCPVNIEKPSAELLAVTATMNGPAVLRGRFKQTKRIAVLSRPLQSEGILLNVKGRGLLWKTLTPVQSEFLISPEGISNLKSKDAMPAAGVSKSLGGVFSALINGDVSALSAVFRVYFCPDSRGGESKQPWMMGLLPLEGNLMAKAIDRIVLTGGEHIESITIDEVGGDVSEVVFLSMQSSADITFDTLSQQEEQYFPE